MAFPIAVARHRPVGVNEAHSSKRPILGVVNQSLITTVNHVSRDTYVHGTIISPIMHTGRNARLGRPTIVKTEKMMIDLKYTHVHLGPVAKISRQRNREDCR